MPNEFIRLFNLVEKGLRLKQSSEIKEIFKKFLKNQSIMDIYLLKKIDIEINEYSYYNYENFSLEITEEFPMLYNLIGKVPDDELVCFWNEYIDLKNNSQKKE